MCFCEYFINGLIRRIKEEILTKKVTKKPHIYEAFISGPTRDRPPRRTSTYSPDSYRGILLLIFVLIFQSFRGI